MQNQRKSAGSASALLRVLSLIFGGSIAPLVGLGGGDSAIPMGIAMATAGVGSNLAYFFLVVRKRNEIPYNTPA